MCVPRGGGEAGRGTDGLRDDSYQSTGIVSCFLADPNSRAASLGSSANDTRLPVWRLVAASSQPRAGVSQTNVRTCVHTRAPKQLRGSAFEPGVQVLHQKNTASSFPIRFCKVAEFHRVVIAYVHLGHTSSTRSHVLSVLEGTENMGRVPVAEMPSLCPAPV